MSTRINTNVTAYEAARNLSLNSDNLSMNIQRLSSGLRINSAADDAAGLVISENMKAQVSGLDQATRNTNDAINLVKTAEGAMGEVQSLLVSMRQLAVHASNLGANDSVAIAADQAQLKSAIQSIDRIAGNTQFSDKKLLDGSASDTATSSPASASATGITGLSLSAQPTAVNNTGTYTNVSVGGVVNASVSSGDANANYAVGDTFGGNLVIQGRTVSLTGTGNTVAQVNTALQAAGISYSFSVADNTVGHGQVTLTSTQAGAQTLTASDFNFSGLTTAGGAAYTNTGRTTSNGNNGTMYLSGQGMATVSAAASVAAGVTTYDFTGQAGADGLKFTDTTLLGNSTGIAGASVSVTAATTSTAAHESLEFQIGANAGQTVKLDQGSVAASQLGKNAKDASGNATSTVNVENIDLTTFKGAQDAISVIDKALSDVSTMRANLGALQSNVLESNARSLGIANQNLQASESTIRDTDLSSEIVQYTKNQILVSAGTSALAQANQAPQAILKLLG